MLDDGGPLLSLAQFMFLVAGAASEGFVSGLDGMSADTFASPVFRRDWEDLLAAIALFGPARVILPAHLAAEFNIETLLELDLAEIVVCDTTGPLKRQLAKTYAEAFDRIRVLEQHPVYTPLVSLDAPIPTPQLHLEADILAGDATYYVARLLDQVGPLVDGLRDIFGYYLEAHEAETLSELNDFNALVTPNAITRWAGLRLNGALRTADLLTSMGLYVREREALESEGFQVAGMSYTPQHLADFDAVDRMLTSAPDGFTEYMERGLELSMFDRADFLAVHAFWKAFFELLNMLAVSESTENPLYLPSDARIDATAAGAQRRETSGSLRIYRLFLAETGRLPHPQSLRDVTLLRANPGLTALRERLGEWASVSRDATEGDAPVIDAIQRDVARAATQLRRAESLNRAGRIVNLLSLPISVFDALKGSSVGIGLAPIGPAIDGYTSRRLKRASWVRFGEL